MVGKGMRTHINTSQAEGRGFESRFPLLSSVALAKEDLILRSLGEGGSNDNQRVAKFVALFFYTRGN